MSKYYYFLFLLFSIVCFGQNPADRDPSFNMFVQPLNQYFVNDIIIKTVVLTDGKIMILDGTKLLKLDNNVLDNSFQIQEMTAANGFSTPIIDDFWVLPDGKIFICGAFATYAGQVRKNIARLHSDGSLDNSFNYTANSTRIPQMLLQQDGGAILFANSFVRVNASGAVDVTFLPATNISYGRMAMQQDGKVLVTHSIVGNFNNGIHKLSRLNLNGSVDPTFTTASFSIGANGSPTLMDIVVQEDGKILVGGYFATCNSTPSAGIVRLDDNGALDITFEPGTGFFDNQVGSLYRVEEMVEQADHKILVIGQFTHYNGVPRRHIIRLNTDGSIDESFLPPDNFFNHHRGYSIALTADQHIYYSAQYDGGRNYDSHIIKLNPDGTKDLSFSNISKGFFTSKVMETIETQDGKLLAVGNFHTYNDQFCHNFARLNADGSLDSTLTYGGLTGFASTDRPYLTDVAERRDGKIYIAGKFSSFNGTPARSIIRVNTDGTRDMSFNAGNGVDYNYASPGSIKDILVAPDGGVVVAGNFEKVGTSDTWGLVKYSPTGSVNWNPDFSQTVGNNVTSLAYQNDGKLLVGTEVDGIFRFTTTFTADNTFVAFRAVQNGSTSAIQVQPDGKILVQGSYAIGTVTKNLLRLNADGSLDNTFSFTLDNNELQIDNFKLLPDGKLMVTTRPGLYIYNRTMLRLNNNGSIDSTFEQQTRMGDVEFLPLSSGKLLVYGEMSTYQNQPALGMVRLMGEDYNFLQGQNRLDSNLNGCDVSDTFFSNLKYSVSGTSGDFDYITNTTGNYQIGISAGAYVITPVFENPEYFTSSPPSITVDFPSQASPIQQNFCVTPLGVHPDLEAVLMPVTDARPGFDATYQLVYKNKGNQPQSGSVTLAFDDASTDLILATPAASSTTPNMLVWNFSSLLPYETRTILLKFNLNTPSEIPALTSGSILQFTASVISAATDDTPEDNVFQFNQTVVNSYDPNDKTCLQGATIPTSQVGDFVHYVIRFENNGTATAQNITVRDVIDIEKYDIHSLIPISGSNLFTTRVIDDNLVEFFFENINLPYADANNDGYVSFKIKTKSNLEIGDIFSNSAAIYFDYNLPVNTNTASTVVRMLSNNEFENARSISVYPNPAADVLNISNPENISFASISIYSMMGQLLFVIPNALHTSSLDISHLSSGNYIAVFGTGEGNLALKFIKR